MTQRPVRGSFPWSHFVVALTVGVSSLVIVGILALWFASYFGGRYDVNLIEMNGVTFGSVQTDAPLILALGTAFGAVSVICARRLWMGMVGWNKSRSASSAREADHAD